MITDRRLSTCRSVLITGLLLTLLVLIGCKSKDDSFDNYLGHLEQQVDRVVKDEVRAADVISVIQSAKTMISGYQPEYVEISGRIHMLAVAHPHDALAYEDAQAASDALMDAIWDELMDLSRDFRTSLTEKEWKKLSDPEFYFEITKYLSEGK